MNPIDKVKYLRTYVPPKAMTHPELGIKLIRFHLSKEEYEKLRQKKRAKETWREFVLRLAGISGIDHHKEEGI